MYVKLQRYKTHYRAHPPPGIVQSESVVIRPILLWGGPGGLVIKFVQSIVWIKIAIYLIYPLRPPPPPPPPPPLPPLLDDLEESSAFEIGSKSDFKLKIMCSWLR